MKNNNSIFALAITVVNAAVAQTAQLKIKSKEGGYSCRCCRVIQKGFKDATANEWAVVPATVCKQ
jgi:hypothetical protein